MITVNEFNDINVIASTKKDGKIMIEIERPDDKFVIELTKDNAEWLAWALKIAIKLHKC